mmetsp:Transcript_75940/g.114365  ORF Transcript_75940/g.114365 Transcript_75940/m.114365 type:complete len:145 (+) Transcript_75940:686-1120(+)
MAADPAESELGDRVPRRQLVPALGEHGEEDDEAQRDCDKPGEAVQDLEEEDCAGDEEGTHPVESVPEANEASPDYEPAANDEEGCRVERGTLEFSSTCAMGGQRRAASPTELARALAASDVAASALLDHWHLAIRACPGVHCFP